MEAAPAEGRVSKTPRTDFIEELAKKAPSTAAAIVEIISHARDLECEIVELRAGNESSKLARLSAIIGLAIWDLKAGRPDLALAALRCAGIKEDNEPQT